ncbi:MAG: hypothetical protein ACF8PN_17115 [Phycisphaerales bacterium]
MPAINQTFSDLWYRVADFQPRLSPHLVVRRQTYRDEVWFVIGDPASSKFYRFNAPAYRFLGLLDGRTTVQEAWDVCNAQLGDDAPTQRDCLNLLSSLQQFGLMRGDLPVDAQRLRERFELIREQRFQELTGKFVFWSIPLFNPEKFLAKFANVGRLVFSRWGFLALAIVSAIALRMVIPRWDELRSQFNSIIAPGNLIYITIVFTLLKAIHELAHGFACKAYGGRVTEIGILFIILLPIPYCDASSAWAFPNKWHRILVSAAGVLVEMFVAAIAAVVWARTEPGLAHTLAYNTMVIASIATIIFNINPLLRYDGYYILADLTEIPNLASRSIEYVKWLTRRYLFGLKGEPPPPTHGKGEAGIMVTHAMCAFPYRLLVMLSIVLIVAEQYFIVGVILATLGGLIWFVWPVMKGLAYVVSEPSLQVVRARAVFVTFGAVVAAIGLIGFVPAPATVNAPAVVEPEARVTIRAPNNGFVAEISTDTGAEVAPGDPLVTIENREIVHQYERAASDLERQWIRFNQALSSSHAEAQQVESSLEYLEEKHARAEESLRELDIRAPIGGEFISPDLRTKMGAFVRRGDAIGVISTEGDLVIRALVDDADFAWLFGRGDWPTAEARLYGEPGTTWTVTIERIREAGQRALPFRSLGQTVEGGDVVVDPTDPEGVRTFTPQYEITLKFTKDGERATPTAYAGARARVLFRAEPQPLAVQWYRRLQQAFAARFDT